MIITNKFTTNYDIYTDAVIGAPVFPSLLFDFAKAKRPDLRLSGTRSGTSTVFDSSGFIKSVDSNVPRISNDPYTGECLGLLVEESRTNVIQNSVNGAYSSTGTTLAPDRSTAYKAVPVGSVNYPSVGTSATQRFSVSGLAVGETQDFTFSAYFAPWGSPSYRPYIVILAGGTSLTTVYALIIFNPDTGTLSGGTNINASVFSEVIPAEIKQHPCGMYHVTWTVRFTQPSTYEYVGCYLQILNEANQATYTANGTSGFQFACMQFENGYGATSYIPTTNASVTRNRDNISYPIGDWYNNTEGTVYVEFKYGAKLINSRVLSLESSGTNYIAVLGSNSGATAGPYLSVRDNGATASVTLITDQPEAYARHRVAFSYKENDFRICRNGENVLSDTLSTVPQNLNILRFGVLGGSNPLNGHIAKFSYFPRSFTSEELQILTI